jgi:hypothetical protein
MSSAGRAALRPKSGQSRHPVDTPKTCQGSVRPPSFRYVSEPQREHPRYAHEAIVTLHVGGSVHQGRTTNVSRGGVCAYLPDLVDVIPIGTDTEVDVQLIFDEETQSEALRLPARVVWCTRLDESFQVGLSFKPLKAELAEYLTMFLRYLDDGKKSARSKRESTLDKRFG